MGSRLSLENLFVSLENDEDELIIDAIDGEDESVALTDAAEDMADAERIEDGVGHSLESLVLMDKLSRRYKKKYGMESDESAIDAETTSVPEEGAVVSPETEGATEVEITPEEIASEEATLSVETENEGELEVLPEPSDEECKTEVDSESVTEEGTVATEGVFNIGSDPKFLKVKSQVAYSDVMKTFEELKKQGLMKIVDTFKKYYKEKKKWDSSGVVLRDIEESKAWKTFTHLGVAEGKAGGRIFTYEYKQIDGCMYAIYRMKMKLKDSKATTTNAISRVYIFFKDENGKLQWKLVARIAYVTYKVLRGNESVDMAFVTGNPGTITMEGASEFFKKIGSYIVLAYKKMIAALQNLMKSIMIWIGGLAVKEQDNFYLSVSSEIPSLLAKNGDKELRLPPKAISDFGKVFTETVSDVMGVKEDISKITQKLTVMQKIANLFTKNKTPEVVESRIVEIRSLKDLMLDVDKSWKERVKGRTARTYVNERIYGTGGEEALTIQKIRDVYTAQDFRKLTKEDAGATKALMNAARIHIKTIEDSYKSVVADVNWDEAGLQTDITLVVNRTRSLLTQSSSLILATYLEYLRYRSFLFRALKTLVGPKPLIDVGGAVKADINLRHGVAGKEKK